VKIALAQINATIGDVDGNVARILRALSDAQAAGADLVIVPEQVVIGYPAKDLLLRGELIARNVAALDHLAKHAAPAGLLVGFAEPNTGARGRPLFNSAALLHRGQRLAVWRKRLLPNYDVFDEARYFEPDGPQPVVAFGGRRLGVSICEDLLAEPLLDKPLYASDPLADLAASGANLLINISASPFTIGKHRWRLDVIQAAAQRHRLPLLYANQVGGNDDLLFDGASCAVDAAGQLLAQAKCFEEDCVLVDLESPAGNRREPLPSDIESLRAGLVMGLADYFRKCGFRSAVVGLSGGIDSAVTAALAAEALGPQNVLGVAMPSRFSSDHSVADARAVAANLSIRFTLIEIEPMHAAFERQLAAEFAGRDSDVTEENVQARIRGGLLMALSNKLGSLLLTTGNKSEVAVGYCTLYGDMCGGLAVISDVPKTMVYQLARHINARAGRDLIPPGSLTKPPSAELRPNQTDQDSLPPYDVLDAILERYEERLETIDEIVTAGFDRAVVERVVRLIQISEYKRQQAAPGLKVTSKAFGSGRRMPIAARPPRA
jgi:NAD+ synthetase